MPLRPLACLALVATALATPLPDHGTPEDKVVLPAIDANVDTFDLANLDPSVEAVFQYREPPPGSLGVTLDFAMHHPVVALERSAYVDVQCSSAGDAVSVGFANSEAFEKARHWPQSLVLVTNSDDCNPENERGVYLVTDSLENLAERSILYNTTSVTWKDVAETMKISYGKVTEDKPSLQLVKQEKRAPVPITPPKCAIKNPIPSAFTCGTGGSMSSPGPSYVSTTIRNLPACRDSCLAWSKCRTFSFASDTKTCMMMSKPIYLQGFKPNSKSTTKFYNRNCFSCETVPGFSLTSTPTFTGGASATPAPSSPTTPTSTDTTTPSVDPASTAVPDSPSPNSDTFATPPVSLTPEQVLTYSSILAAVTIAPDGIIAGDLGPSATVDAPISAPTFDPTNTAASAALESALEADGIVSAENTVLNSASALGQYDESGDLTGITEIAPDGTTSTSAGTKRDLRSITTSDFASKALYARSNGTERAFRLGKRYSFGDFLGDFDTYGCNDFATSLSDTLEGVCAGVDGGKAIYCLATGCQNGQQAPPPATKYSFDYAWSVNFPTLAGRNLYADAQGQVLCQNCGMTVSKIAFKGTIVVVLATSQLQSAVVTASETATMNLVMNLITNGPASGSWSGDISTSTLASITTPNVFSIAPKIIYGLGVTYQTDGPVNVIGGASMTLDNAATDLDLVAGTASNSVNWQPSGSVQYPTLSTSARVVMTPFMRTSIQMSIQVFGRQIQNIAALTTQTNIGFDGSLLLADANSKRDQVLEPKSLPERSTPVEKRGWFGGNLFKIIAAAQAAAAAAGVKPPPKVICSAGRVLLRATMRTTNAVSFGGAQQNLYDNNYPFTPKCFSVPIAPPTPAEVSALAGNGAAFCSSFIKYVPWASTTNLVTTVTAISTSFKAAPAISIFPKTSTVLTTQFVAPSGYTGSPIKRSAMVAPLLPRQAIPTPTQVVSWPPQKISQACTQVATGFTVVTAYTSTATFYNSTTIKTVRATVTAPTPLVTKTIVSTGCSTQATGAAVNPQFNPASQYDPRVPAPWSVSGIATYENCQGFSFGIGCDLGQRSSQAVMSMLFSGTYDSGAISQPLTNLIVGKPYNLTVSASYGAFGGSVNCVTSYQLDGVPFKSLLPQMQSGLGTYGTDTTLFYPTATSHTLSVSVNCPTYNKQENNRAVARVNTISAAGPQCPYFYPATPAKTGCPAGIIPGPVLIDNVGSIFNVTCGSGYGGTVMASTGGMDFLGTDTDNDCLAWCNTWGGACASVTFGTDGNCVLYSDNDGALNPDASQIWAKRIQ